MALLVKSSGNATNAAGIGFLDLPPELRKIIYGFAFKDGIFCRCKNAKTKPARPACGDCLALVYTCKQVYFETVRQAYNTITVCGNEHHARGLQRLATINRVATHSIRRLRLNLDWVTESEGSEVMAFRTQRWEAMLVHLTYERMTLQSLTVNLTMKRHPPSSTPVVRWPSFYDALMALESCRLIRFTGPMAHHHLTHFLAKVNVSGRPPVRVRRFLKAPDTTFVQNEGYLEAWNRDRAIQKRIQEETWEEDSYHTACKSVGGGWRDAMRVRAMARELIARLRRKGAEV